MKILNVKNKIVSNSIAISFAIIIFLMLIQTILSIWRFNEVKVEFEKVVDVYNVRMQLVQKMRVISRERVPILFTMINTEDAFALDDLLIQFQELGSQYLATRELLLDTQLTPEEIQMLEKHREFARTIVPGQREVIRLITESEISSARRLLVDKVSPDQIEALKNLDELIAFESKSSKQAMEKARLLFDRTQFELGLTTIIGSLISILIGTLVSIRFAFYVKTLKRNKDVLEDTVAERTKELVDSNKKLEFMANYDSLTNLPNRSLFIVLLEKAIKQAKRSDYSVALLFIDLDGFKAINDTYGHDYGDELLRQVASRLISVVREVDSVFRLGGDEFTLILENFHDTSDVIIITKKIINILSEPFSVLNEQCKIGSSIGIALFPEHAKNLDELIKYADTVMYDVKNSGKNNYKLYKSG